jgi:hypothetical protein
LKKEANVDYIRVSVECNKCYKGEIEIMVSPYIPAVTGGPPDNWCPAEGGEIEGWDDNCPHCGVDIDYAFIEQHHEEIFRLVDEEERKYKSRWR